MPRLPEFLNVDRDLRQKEQCADNADKFVYDRGGLVGRRVERMLEVLVDASRAEQDREANLNARGAAVATVAGLIVSVSGAVAKSVFDTPRWTDWTKVAAIVLFIAALFVVAAAMVMAVFQVLRPGQGRQTKNYLGETLVDLWLDGHESKLINADRNRVNLLFVDRCLRTLPAWHFRNRRKARWLRRAWSFLAVGIVLIAVAAVLVLARQIGVIEPEKGGPAADLSWEHLVAMIAGTGVLAWLAIRIDLVEAIRPEPGDSEATVKPIEDYLEDSPLQTQV